MRVSRSGGACLDRRASTAAPRPPRLDRHRAAARYACLIVARVLSALSARVNLHTDEAECGGAVSRVDEHLSGGALNAALANELGKLMADFTGRGATRSRAVVQQDLVVCVFEDSATRSERTLLSAGKADLVRLQRDALQRAMSTDLIAAVERLTKRRVRTFMSGTDEGGGSSVEAFVLEPEVSEMAELATD